MMDLLEGLDDKIEFGSEIRKKEFTLNEGNIFLNHGSYGTVPRRIQKVQQKFLEEIDDHPDDWYRRNMKGYWEESKKALAEFVNCDPQDVVFVENATAGVNTILKSVKYKQGDVIMSTKVTYGGVARTVEATASLFDFLGVQVKSLVLEFPIISEDDVCRQYEDFFKANPNIRITVIDHITSPSAVVMPIERLIEISQKYGALTMIDGAHSPGQLPLDFKNSKADFFTGNLHKWMFTPRGCALLYVKREHHRWVKPLVTSWNHYSSLDSQFFLVATNDQTPYATAKYSLEFYNRIGGMGRIIDYCSKLASEAHEYLKEKLGAESLAIPKSMESPFMRQVRLPQLSKYPANPEGAIAIHTDIRYKYNIQCAIEPIQDNLYLRISCSVYNTMEEYRKLADVMLQVIEESK